MFPSVHHSGRRKVSLNLCESSGSGEVVRSHGGGAERAKNGKRQSRDGRHVNTRKEVLEVASRPAACVNGSTIFPAKESYN